MVERKGPPTKRSAGTSRVAAIAMCAALLLASRSREARADDAAPASRLTFVWKAPQGCPAEGEVRARVDHVLGASATAHENVDARAIVSTDGEMFRAEIELNSAGQSSSRRMDDVSCDALADAVALIVALAVDPEAVAKRSATPAPAIVTPAPAPAPTSKNPDSKARETWSEPPSRTPDSKLEPRRPVYFGAAVLLDTATLASLAAGAEVVAGYNPRHAAFELSGTWLSTQDARLAPGSPKGASEHAFGVGARGCWEIFGSALDVGPCGGAELDGIFASGFGATTSTDAAVALFRALIGARAKLQFSRFVLRLGAEAAVPFTRPSFVIDNAGTIQHISPATLRATFGAEVHF